MLAGFAEVDFTPAPGLCLFGQMHERRAERVRDSLMATAAAFASGDAGVEDAVVLVSVDVCLLDAAFVEQAQALFQRRTGAPARKLLVHATHTHVAPATISLMAGKVDPAFRDRLLDAVVEAASAAVAQLAPAALFAGTGQMDQMGWNRRAMFEDGASQMYGHAGMPGFIGLEGPRDPALPMLFARGQDGKIRGVIVNFSTHPNCLEGDCIYSADIPGEVRQVLKRLLGDVPVLYLTGAAGNTAPSILEPYTPRQPWRGEEGLVRSGLYLGGEAARVIASTVQEMESPVLRLEQATLPIPRRSWPEPGEPTYPLPLTTGEWPEAVAYYRQAELEWPGLLDWGSPIPVRLNVLRLGDVAICTNPAELFVEYGLAIRDASPARVTMVSELTDGYAGYVPTPIAFQRGGYETWPAPTSQLTAEAGDMIEKTSAALLSAAFGTGREA